MFKSSQITALLSCFILTQSFAADRLTSFKEGWISKALKLQRDMDLNAPLREATFLATHNSYNSKSYQIPFVRYIDPNQTLSIYEQLEMGMRGLEFDAHWTLNHRLEGDILLCHGQKRLGCGLNDRPIIEGLEELRDWLQVNPNEVVILFIERYLEGHEPRLAFLLHHYLGDFIYKAGEDTKTCQSLPTDISKADILKANKQLIIITKKCAPYQEYKESNQFKQNWNDYVFAGISDIPHQQMTFMDAKIGSFKDYPDCSASNIFKDDVEHHGLWRIYEDRTKLSNMAGQLKQIHTGEMQMMMKCGINWPNLDMLSFDDDRLYSAIWSWAPYYPKKESGSCAYYQLKQGIKNTSCSTILEGYACKESLTHQMKVISLAGIFSNGENICQLFAGKNWHFASPVNGKQMTHLFEGMSRLSMQKIWLNYSEDQGQWVAKN